MPICITGMHRSGTSMVARLLNLCGLYLGPQEKMMPPKPDNPKGFWENIDFAALNESILLHLGGRWNSPPPVIRDGWELDPMLIPLSNTARDMAREFTDHESWGWKDPRTSLTLPFWNHLLPNLKLVICLRNPLAVAHSLQKRNQFSEFHGIGLWQTYNQSLLAAARSEQYVITHYDAYFNDPKTELFRVLDWLGWQVPAESVDRACKTISSSLRNNRFTTRELMNTGASSEALTLYGDMCAEASYVCNADLLDKVGIQTETISELEAEQAYEIARTIIKKGGHEEAIEILKKLLAIYPTHNTVHNDLGVLYFQKGDKEHALEHFKAALQHNPKDITARKNIADCYLNLGQIDEAVIIYEKILTDYPDDVETLLTIGNLCYQAGRHEDAACFYESVLRIRSGNAIQGQSLQGLGQTDTH